MRKKGSPLNPAYIMPNDLSEFSHQDFGKVSDSQISEVASTLKNVLIEDEKNLKKKRMAVHVHTAILLTGLFIALNCFLFLVLYDIQKMSILVVTFQSYIILMVSMSPLWVIISEKYDSLRADSHYNLLKPLFPNLSFSPQALLPFDRWRQIPPLREKILEFRNVFRAKIHGELVDIGTVSYRNSSYMALSSRKFSSFISIPHRQVGKLVITNHPPLWQPQKKFGVSRNQKLDWRAENFVAYATNDANTKLLKNKGFISSLLQLSQHYHNAEISIFLMDTHSLVLIEKTKVPFNFPFSDAPNIESAIKHSRSELLVLINLAEKLAA